MAEAWIEKIEFVAYDEDGDDFAWGDTLESVIEEAKEIPNSIVKMETHYYADRVQVWPPEDDDDE